MTAIKSRGRWVRLCAMIVTNTGFAGILVIFRVLLDPCALLGGARPRSARHVVPPVGASGSEISTIDAAGPAGLYTGLGNEGGLGPHKKSLFTIALVRPSGQQAEAVEMLTASLLWAKRSRRVPFRKLARTLKAHWEGILNGINSRLSTGGAKAINGLLIPIRLTHNLRDGDSARILSMRSGRRHGPESVGYRIGRRRFGREP